MNQEYKEIRRGEKHLEAYTGLDLYTTHNGEVFQLYKRAGMRVREVREAQDRVPASLFIKHDDAITEVRMLQDEIDKELDRLLDGESSSGSQVHDLVEETLEIAAGGLMEISRLHGDDPEKTAAVLGNVKGMTNKVVSKCLEDTIFFETMLAVARKDFNVFQHSVHVATYAILYSIHEGFLSQDLQPFVLAAMLHDIGMVFLPETLLKCTRRFRKNEYREMLKHPKMGYEVLREAFEDPRIARVALEHHERLNGSGYPVGHDQLHEWSQIIGIFEVFDGMVGWRPHRNAPGPVDAIQVLVEMSKKGEVSKRLVDSFCTSLVGKVID